MVAILLKMSKLNTKQLSSIFKQLSVQDYFRTLRYNLKTYTGKSMKHGNIKVKSIKYLKTNIFNWCLEHL